MRMPTLEGRSLAGSDLRIPDELAGDTNILLLAFQQRHQRDIDAWIEALGAAGIATSPPHDAKGRATSGRLPVVLYEIPLIGARWQPFRGFIDGGMSSSIRVPEILARTVTVYGQIGEVESALQLPDRGQVYAVVERAHEVLSIHAGWPGDVEAVVTAATR
jgi:hypothetical protein